MPKKAEKPTRENKSKLVHFDIVEVKAQTRRTPARITLNIPEDLAQNLMKGMFGRYCPDNFPKIMSLMLSWTENLTDEE